MSRRRHLLLSALLVSPLAALAAVLTAWRGPAAVAGVLLLAAVVAAVLHVVLWRQGPARSLALLAELDATTPEEARWLLRDIRRETARCAADRDRLAALLEDLSSGLGEGLVVVTSELRIRLINPMALRFCGVRQVRGDSHLLDILREPAVVEVFEAAAGGLQPRPAVVENPRGLWEVRAFPLRGGGAVGLLSDVGLTRRASEFRRRFVQDLSHELRSPLTVLRTSVETLEGEVPSELAQVLIRQVERIDRLTAELYELASIESGQVELRLEAVPVGEVVREVLADFRPEAERASITVTTEIGEHLRCRCDRRGLYRVLSNLVDNAVKYNRRGGTVQVRASSGGGEVTLQVADTGAGIPAAELQAVLQRFYRVERARTPGRGGLGLGLAIVKHLVQHMGGRLSLDSTEGLGTTVTLVLPEADGADEGLANSSGTAAGPTSRSILPS